MTVELEDLEAWIAETRRRGAKGAAIQRVDEIRPVVDGRNVTVGFVRWADLIAYADGVVIKTRVVDPPGDLKARLEGLGLRVREVRADIG